ncbi:MAG: hypothetical protein RLN72_11645 [Henriciella sp.]
MSGAVAIRTFASLPEALVVQCLLQARGLDVSLANYWHISIDWWSIHAFGGVRMHVPASQYDTARTAIIEAIENAPDELNSAYGSYETPKRYGRAATYYFWLNFFGVIAAAYVAIVLFLDFIIPESWKPKFYSPYWLYSEHYFSFDEFTIYHSESWLFTVLMIAYLTVYYGMIILLGAWFSADARRFLRERHKARA